MRRLKEAMLLLIANDGTLGPEWSDHALKREWAGHRERHVGGDFLLVYTVDDSGKAEQVIFTRAGTHAELFSE
jgi:mRNA interferase YafQ